MYRAQLDHRPLNVQSAIGKLPYTCRRNSIRFNTGRSYSVLTKSKRNPINALAKLCFSPTTNDQLAVGQFHFTNEVRTCIMLYARIVVHNIGRYPRWNYVREYYYFVSCATSRDNICSYYYNTTKGTKTHFKRRR